MAELDFKILSPFKSSPLPVKSSPLPGNAVLRSFKAALTRTFLFTDASASMTSCLAPALFFLNSTSLFKKSINFDAVPVEISSEDISLRSGTEICS